MSTPTENSAHTPGPWVIGSSNEVFPDGEGGESFSEWLEIVGPDGKPVCQLPGRSAFARGSAMANRDDANANLIAVAPDMKALIEESVRYFLARNLGEPARELSDKLCAILAKAEGRA